MNKRVRPKGLGSFFVWWLFKATAEYNERNTIGVAPVPPPPRVSPSRARQEIGGLTSDREVTMIWRGWIHEEK